MEYVRKNSSLATPSLCRKIEGSAAGSCVKFIFLLYDLIFSTIGILLYLIYLCKKFCAGNPRRGIGQRFGFYSAELLEKVQGKEVIWIHAVSVGETKAATPLISALRQSNPDAILILSNVTETGHATAKKIPELNGVIFFPFDSSVVVRRALRQIRPRCILILETEIWPNFIRYAHAGGIPVFLVNGRISDRSYPRYRSLRFLFEPLLRCFTGFCMQTPEDAERIRLLGAPEERVQVTKNLKFDIPSRAVDQNVMKDLRKSLGFAEDAVIFVAGSTHEGEEVEIAAAYRRLQQDFPRLFLLLVPRHPERARAVADALEKQRFSVVMRSRVGDLGRGLVPGEVLIGDTLGEMLDFYLCSDLVFVGGSLINIGGHNLLEPASVGKAVLFGPHVQNFREISRLLLSHGAGLQVRDAEDLAASANRLLVNAELRRQMGEAGHLLLARHAGATVHTLDFLMKTALSQSQDGITEGFRI